MIRLLVVLGHSNTDDAVLSSTARLRCITAATYLKQAEVNFLLTTGAFGDNFNRSPLPHGTLLLDEIRRQAESLTGIEILGHTTSAFTEEDIFQARRCYADISCTDIVFVTSKFHGPRVTEMAKLVFRDRRVDILLAEDGCDISEATRKNETKKLKRFRQRWVDLPLYHKDSAFPVAAYENAMDQHKHSDSVSLAIVTGALVFACYPHTKIDYAKSGLDASGLLFVCGLVGLFLLCLYLRFAAFAYIARQLMRGLELGWGYSGFSYNHDRFYRSRFPYLGFFRTTRVLTVLTLFIVVANFVVATILALK
jgi:DUF218 domain